MDRKLATLSTPTCRAHEQPESGTSEKTAVGLIGPACWRRFGPSAGPIASAPDRRVLQRQRESPTFLKRADQTFFEHCPAFDTLTLNSVEFPLSPFTYLRVIETYVVVMETENTPEHS